SLNLPGLILAMLPVPPRYNGLLIEASQVLEGGDRLKLTKSSLQFDIALSKTIDFGQDLFACYFICSYPTHSRKLVHCVGQTLGHDSRQFLNAFPLFY